MTINKKERDELSKEASRIKGIDGIYAFLMDKVLPKVESIEDFKFFDKIIDKVGSEELFLMIRTRPNFLDKIAEKSNPLGLVGKDDVFRKLVKNYAKKNGPINLFTETVIRAAKDRNLLRHFDITRLAVGDNLDVMMVNDLLLAKPFGDIRALEVPYLTKLDLSVSNMEVGHAKILAETIKNFPHLKEFNFTGNKIGVTAVGVIAETLSKSSGLKIRGLKSLNFKNIDSQQLLIRVLPQLPDLESVVVEYFGPAGPELLVKELSKSSSLRMIGLERLIFTDIEEEDLKVFIGSQLQLPDLRGLSIFDNLIGNEVAKALAENLKKFPKLEGLRFCGNEIGVEGVNALFKVLPNLTHLKTLYLFYSRIEDESAELLVEAVKRSPQLKEIAFLDKDLGDNCKKILVKALLGSSELKIIGLTSLNFAELNDTDFKSLIKILPQLPDLESLNIANPIGREDERLLTEALKKLPNQQVKCSIKVIPAPQTSHDYKDAHLMPYDSNVAIPTGVASSPQASSVVAQQAYLMSIE